MRVLLIEDDPMIGDAVMLALRDATYAVDWARDGEAGLALFANQQYEMVLVDLGLPKMDGYAVLTRLRQKDAQVPILVVTARDGLDDIEKGLDLGADDYVCKPFEFRELLARMRAVTRRKAGSAAPILSNGEIDLDPASREVSYRGQSLRMTSREFSLLQALLQRPGAILSRSDLEERIYNWDQEIDSNAVEFLIHSIRKKLGSDIIRNVRGLGWMVAKRQ
ncbi:MULTISPECIES: response regulator transcription factor [Microvirgula]|uniref:DNA-binding response regulator n=1 Tax=Microvirgula aerodenitrificans TaxID=57480 RepID=A0A2S0PCH7_9NEIS|nr:MULTISPECIES: response regulator transcription factor [Microvirgula]AVY95045.1 DNA-binding response regulator [Microvirgula aerodenitrificans]RAS15936.1 winged helix family two component transcriptional regulator [Microvirgula sp. AG722]